jgi:hypothetical protein
MITKENIAIILGFILGTIVAAGIIFFIVIGIGILSGAIASNPTHSTYDEGITGPGEGVSGVINYYDGMTIAFLFKGGPGLINETECDSNSKQFGENCTCRSCMSWSGYDTDGFINQTGIYFSNGTSTGIPHQEVDKQNIHLSLSCKGITDIRTMEQNGAGEVTRYHMPKIHPLVKMQREYFIIIH